MDCTDRRNDAKAGYFLSDGEPDEAAIIAATPGMDEAMRAKLKAAGAACGWQARMFEGKAYWYDIECGVVNEYDMSIGFAVYDPVLGLDLD